MGYPEERERGRGYATLLRTILGQQVSFLAADAMWRKFVAAAGDPADPGALLALDDAALRACGFSRQKAAYGRGLAEAVASGALDFDALPVDDEEAVAALVALKGIGRWSAEVYLLFSEGRPDVFPAGRSGGADRDGPGHGAGGATVREGYAHAGRTMAAVAGRDGGVPVASL